MLKSPQNHAEIRRGLSYAFLGALMSASFLLPWKVAARCGDAQLAVLVLLTSAALFNTFTWWSLERAPVTDPETAQSSRAEPPLYRRSIMLLLAAQLACLTLAGNYCSAEAVARMSGALLAVIQRCEVIVVALLGAVALRERVRRSFWIGTFISVCGLYVLSHKAGTEASFDPLGTLYALGAALCFGSMTVLTRKYIAHVRPIALNALRLWLSVGLWFVVTRRLPAIAQMSRQLLLFASLAGFFGPFLSRMGALFSARHVPANLTALAGLITPVLTLVLGFVFIHDLPTTRELGGGAIMLLGVSVPVFELWFVERSHLRA